MIVQHKHGIICFKYCSAQKIIVRTHEDDQKTLQVTEAKKGGEKFAATHTSHGCLSQTPSRQSCLGSWYMQEEEKETLIYCQELSTTEAIMKQFTDHNLVEIAAF